MKRKLFLLALLVAGCAALTVAASQGKTMQKLELTWVGKDEKIAVEPRILLEDAAKSNTELDPKTENMLIHGDNLLALKGLE